MHWRIADAATGRIASGYITVADLLEVQPWGESVSESRLGLNAAPLQAAQ
jgi:hypothetical protein